MLDHTKSADIFRNSLLGQFWRNIGLTFVVVGPTAGRRRFLTVRYFDPKEGQTYAACRIQRLSASGLGIVCNSALFGNDVGNDRCRKQVNQEEPVFATPSARALTMAFFLVVRTDRAVSKKIAVALCWMCGIKADGQILGLIG